MRLESTNGDERKVWLTDAEIAQLRRHAASTRDDIVIQLGAFVGLRAFEIPQVQPQHVSRTADGDHYRLRVPHGKDTSGNGGKPRDAYLPPDVEAALHRFQTEHEIARTTPFVDITTSAVRAVVKRTAARAADATGQEDYQHVSSHDLRRRFAQRLLVDEQMNPRVVMAVGGWDSFQAVEPYLNAPSEAVVNDAFENADIGV
jgi:Phage integrase family.